MRLYNQCGDYCYLPIAQTDFAVHAELVHTDFAVHTDLIQDEFVEPVSFGRITKSSRRMGNSLQLTYSMLALSSVIIIIIIIIICIIIIIIIGDK